MKNWLDNPGDKFKTKAEQLGNTKTGSSGWNMVMKQIGTTLETNNSIVDKSNLKRGIKEVESNNGSPLFMKNPTSTASGFYGQKWSELKDLPEYKNITRDEFIADTNLQNSTFDKRYEGKLGKVTGLQDDGQDLYNEYKHQIKNFPYTATELSAISNMLGRDGTRQYLGYVERDGKKLEEVLPERYGEGVVPVNKTPKEYVKKFNSWLDE